MNDTSPTTEPTGTDMLVWADAVAASAHDLDLDDPDRKHLLACSRWLHAQGDEARTVAGVPRCRQLQHVHQAREDLERFARDHARRVVADRLGVRLP